MMVQSTNTAPLQCSHLLEQSDQEVPQGGGDWILSCHSLAIVYTETQQLYTVRNDITNT